MNKVIVIIIILIALLVAGTFLIPKNNSTQGALKVATTIFPLYDIAQRVAGDKVEVVSILPPGATPHTFELTPSDILKLNGVSVIFAIGHGVDNWVLDVKDVLPDIEIVFVDTDIELRSPIFEVDHEGLVDPHYWLSLTNGQQIAKNVAQELINRDVDNTIYYTTLRDSYISELQSVKSDLNKLIEPLENRQLLVFHESWNYFANDFGFEIVGVFEPAPGREPSPQYLAQLQTIAINKSINVIFSEPQFSTLTLKPFVNDIGLRIEELDPLGGVDGRDSYIDMIRFNVQTIINALQ